MIFVKVAIWEKKSPNIYVFHFTSFSVCFSDKTRYSDTQTFYNLIYDTVAYTHENRNLKLTPNY